jgi:hypothetical protein
MDFAVSTERSKQGDRMNAAMSGGFFYTAIFFAALLVIRGLFLLVPKENTPSDKRSVVMKRLSDKYRREGCAKPEMMATVHIDALRYVDYFRIDAAGEMASGKTLSRIKDAWLRNTSSMLSSLRGNSEEVAVLIKTIEGFVTGMSERDLAGHGSKYKSHDEIVEELYAAGSRI